MVRMICDPSFANFSRSRTHAMNQPMVRPDDDSAHRHVDEFAGPPDGSMIGATRHAYRGERASGR